MNIIIVGAGKVGQTLIDFFSREGHDITIIESNQKLVNNIINQYDVTGVAGNGASYLVQKEAGADKADVLIALASTDELNMMICMVAKELGVRHTIARVRNPEYSEQVSFICNNLGITMVVNPELEAAYEITRIIQFPSALKVDAFAKGKVDIAEINITETHPLVGTRLCDMRQHSKIEVLVCAVKRDDNVIIPYGDFEIKAGDAIYITGSHSELFMFFKELNLLKKKIKSVMLIGGSKIAYYLALQLIKMNISVKIVESDTERCEELAMLLPKATIIHGDGTDSDVLLEEGIGNVDACVTLTNIDEENIIISMFALSQNISKVITKVTRMSLISMMPHVGIDSSVISPKFLVSNNIVRYVRGINNTLGNNIETLYKIVDNKVEALEFKVTQGFSSCSIPLKDLKLKTNVLIACIKRGKDVICPHGMTTIEVGDRVIVVTTNEGLSNLEDIIV